MSPNDSVEAAPDDLESYRRFREVALGLIPSAGSAPAARQGFFQRIRDVLSAEKAKMRSLQANYISLIAPLRQPGHLMHSPAALAGVLALKSGHLDQAGSIFEELRARVLRPSPLFYLWQGSLIFVVGLLVIILLAAFTTRPVYPLVIEGASLRIFAASTAGCMGAFVSMMQRLDHFVSLVDRPRDYLYWTGFALPVVGGTLGAFAAMVLLSNVVNVSIGGSGDTQSASVILYVIIGFIAGYSERFSKSLVKLAEEQLGGRDRTPPDAEKPRS